MSLNALPNVLLNILKLGELGVADPSHALIRQILPLPN
jgi:hypothetical protein